MNETDLTLLEDKLGYKFKRPDLLKQALTHSSYANENGFDRSSCNERLEYLGDAVLEMIISQILFNYTPLMTEGDMTRLRSRLVCEKSLCSQANAVSLGSFLLLGRGEESSGGRERPSILADAFEAVTAAIYLDGGLQTAAEFIEKAFHRHIGGQMKDDTDYKTLLQELIQNKPGIRHCYKLIAEDGPDHSKTFTVEVIINGKVEGCGTGKSKKSAEQSAAKEAINNFG